jgi:hypothetical protein
MESDDARAALDMYEAASLSFFVCRFRASASFFSSPLRLLFASFNCLRSCSAPLIVCPSLAVSIHRRREVRQEAG